MPDKREDDRVRSGRATTGRTAVSVATSPPRRVSSADGRAIRGPTSGDLGWFTVGTLLTVIDAVATHAWLHTGIAAEGNPLLVGYIDTFGAGVAMVGRASWGLALLVGLVVLAPYTRRAKQGLPVVVIALSLVGALHLRGLLHYL